MNNHITQSTNFAVFTVCNIAYLPKVLVLADSLNEFHKKKLNVVIFDKKQELSYLCENINIFWLEELDIPKWRELAFMYDIIEFSTSLKPFIASMFLRNFSKVIFLDPDTAIYSKLDSILNELDDSPVILTPHYIKPQPDTLYESDLAMMRFGSFNLGFFAVRKSDEANEFLNWWNKRCIDFCFMESQFGLSTDQKWVSIAPCFFNFLKISFNPGYNMAAWNTFERKITSLVNGEYIINDHHKLIFFHFSNFNHSDPQYLKKRASNEVDQEYEYLEILGKQYSKKLKFYEDRVDKIKYTYDYMSDGSYISPTLRRAYSFIRPQLKEGHDPFEIDGSVGRFAKKNRLISKKIPPPYFYPNLKSVEAHKYKLSLIYFIMRWMLRIVGPNKFYDLSKLMAYLSVYRLNHDYWRLEK